MPVDKLQKAAVKALLGKKVADDVLVVPHDNKPASTYDYLFWRRAFPGTLTSVHDIDI
jgi:hypothetical protein